MRNKENISHIARGKRAITSLSPTFEISTDLLIHYLPSKVKKTLKKKIIFSIKEV